MDQRRSGVQLPVHPWLVLTRRTPILDRLVTVMICTLAPAGRAEGRIARIAGCPGAIEGQPSAVAQSGCRGTTDTASAGRSSGFRRRHWPWESRGRAQQLGGLGDGEQPSDLGDR
jgi:hypothetical protein